MSKHCHSVATPYRCPYTTDMFNPEGNQAMNLEAIIETAEITYAHATEARQAALEACARCGAYLDKAKQAEADAKQILDWLREYKGQV